MTTKNTRRITLAGPEFLKGGLNVNDHALIVPPEEMVEANNILIGATPSRRKRPGQELFCTDESNETADYPTSPDNGGAGDDPILGLYEFWRYDSGTGGPKSTLMVRQGTKIWAIDLRTGVAVDLTGALTLPADGVVTFQAFEGKVYWTGTGAAGTPEGYYSWDGTSSTADDESSNVPPDGIPTHIVTHGGRMWAWGVPGYPYRLYYSDFYDATSWDTTIFNGGSSYNDTGVVSAGTATQAGSLDLDPFGDPVGISGGVSFQDRLYVFLRRGSFEVQGNTINNFFVKTISRQIGCISHGTIVPIANDVIYASERGVLRLSSSDKAIQTEYGFISRPIKRLWNTLINRSLFAQYSAVYDEEENLYLLSGPSSGSTTNDTILAFNAQTSIWCGTWDGHDARCLATYIDSGRTRVIAGREDGRLTLLNSAARTDLGEAYTGRFKTGTLFPGGEIDIQHIWKQVTVLASADGNGTLVLNAYVDSVLVKTQTVNLSAGVDVLGSTFILGSSELGSGQFVPVTMSLKGQGYGLQLEVIFNSTADIQIYGFMVECVPANSPIRGVS